MNGLFSHLHFQPMFSTSLRVQRRISPLLWLGSSFSLWCFSRSFCSFFLMFTVTCYVSPPSPLCLANWLLPFYQSAFGSPTWVIFYPPSSLEEFRAILELLVLCFWGLGRPLQAWLVPLCLLNISSTCFCMWSMPCKRFTLSWFCLWFLVLFPILIIRSLLPEVFMQQDIICNMTHGPTTKPFFLLYCLLL